VAILIRQGDYAKYDSNRQKTGEWACVLDKKKIYIAFAPGDVKQMATYEDMEANITAITNDIINSIDAKVAEAVAEAIVTQFNTALNKKVNKETITDVTVEATQWIGVTSPYIYYVPVNDLTSTSYVYISPGDTLTTDQINAFINANISHTVSDNNVILSAVNKPSIDIPVKIVVKDK
jgi:hypothetical protein